MSSVVVVGAAGHLRPLRPVPIRSEPFTLGVASGDPHPDSVMLWTPSRAIACSTGWRDGSATG